MIFGLQQRFAIESELDSSTPQYLFGKICLWSSSMRLGNYDQVVLLPPVANFFQKTLRFQGKRTDQLLSTSSAGEVLNTIRSILYRNLEYEGFIQQNFQQRKRYEKFCICPNGSEAFDGEFAVLIESSEGERFIWEDFKTKNIHEIMLASAEYETVIQAFLDWIHPLINYDSLSDYFSDDVFVLVGNYKQISRPEIQALIRRLGGRIDQKVSEQTSFLVLGDTNSQGSYKIAQAESLHIPILTEEEFIALLPSSLK
ncbi:Imm42 family immunity protein [Calothrix sp. NIES-2098]|uniref:Imm42 family immunity protein n=1 Tax=Calothrix sp. NIES-2098 TaxID=1954171 RepID=UPI000B6041A7|nr:DNA ligase [Calothrix sp. NIES-2098]